MGFNLGFKGLKRPLDLSDDAHPSAAGFKNEWIKTSIRPDALRELTGNTSRTTVQLKDGRQSTSIV